MAQGRETLCAQQHLCQTTYRFVAGEHIAQEGAS